MEIIRRINNTKLKSKFLAILFIVFLLSCIVTIVFAKAVEGNYNQLLYEKTDQILTYFSGDLEKQLQSIEALSAQIIADKAIQNDLALIAENEPGDYRNAIALRRITDSLSAYMSFQNNISSMSIYTGEFRAIGGWDRPIDEDEQFAQLKQGMQEARGKSIWQIYPGRDSVLCAREIREIDTIDVSSLGYLVIHIDLPRIIRRDRVSFSEFGDDLNVEIIQEENYVYPSEPTQFGQTILTDARYNIVDVEGHKYFAVSRDSSYVDWSYRIFLDFDEVYGSTRASIMIAMLLAVIVMALLSLLGGYFVASQTTHFELLIQKINRFYQSGIQPSETSKEYEGRYDEIGVLHRNFDKMTQEIAAHVQENYLKTILLKDAQLRLLQEQVNPHFLFNTLNLTSWLAKNGDSVAVTTVIEALARLLRSSLSDASATLSIANEMSLVNDYLYILKVRYGDRLHYSQSIAPSTRCVQVPKMAIQGLVENCINHAMENMTDTCHILIESRAEGSRATVAVMDNGPGMDEDMLQMLRDKTVQPRGMGVGLVNIDNRVKLIYSEKYGLRIRSGSDGTCVTIELPMDMDIETAEE